MRPAAALSLFYASSFAFLGLYLPYFNLYLDRLGMSGLQIGTVSAILPLCGVLRLSVLWDPAVQANPR